MSVRIDERSAELLLAEGAVRFDADTAVVTRGGEATRLPSDACCPVLVYGRSEAAVRKAAERLESRGLAAWQVVGELAAGIGLARVAGRPAGTAPDAP